MGEVTENIHTFALPNESQPYTFKMKYRYDSWKICASRMKRKLVFYSEAQPNLRVANRVQGEITENTLVVLNQYAAGAQASPHSEDECYWYHPDHLGSASWVSDKAGKGIQHLYYLPWGEELDNQRATDYASRYTFSGKERDMETGYGYFGARYYNSDLSIWLSVDPMADKYPGVSPYTYCANNPVRLVDPDGREIWKPDLEGNLIAERGDNAWTLAKFLNDTPEKAIAMLKSQGYKINNGILNLKIGDKVKLDNVFTRSIASPSNKENDDYNCWGSAYAGVQDKTLNREIGIPYPAEFDNVLTEQFESVPLSEAQFGKTIIRFEHENPYQGTKYDNLVQKGLASRQSGMIGSTSHAAVYYGKSNDGTIYVFTKNGYNSRKPMVVPLKSLLGPEGYGKVTGIGGESGYYNLKN